MRDSQVQCKNSGESSTHWIAPSTVQTAESKAIVIRISATRVLIVETLRPAGLYYKIPLQTQGALVYEVDLLETGHGLGYKLSLPVGRSVSSDPFFMASYPLKQGEFTISNGYKITIIESGTFGDVVKVEKVFENVVGQDSLTRFDAPKRGKSNNKRRNKSGNAPQASAPNASKSVSGNRNNPKPEGGARPPRPEGEHTAQAGKPNQKGRNNGRKRGPQPPKQA